MIETVVVVLIVSLPLTVATGLGARTRGMSGLSAILAGLCFPVAWAAWYLLDEHPYGESHRKAV